MKQSLLLSSMALFAVVGAGCTQESLDTRNSSADNNGDKITLCVSAVTKNPEVQEETGTRISYSSTDATWETGDKIFLIKSDGTTITLTLTNGAGSTSGSFSSTDPVVAGTYIPYAVSKTSLDKGFVSVSAGVITLNLNTPGGSTLADALEHDILKGESIVLAENQSTATLGNLNTHILSYLRFRFTSASKAITTIGMDSAGGVYKTVSIAANGTVSGSDPSTDVVNVTAEDDESGTYAGYFAVYKSTSTSLMAHAEDEDGGQYTRLVSTNTTNYTPGNVYGKTFTLTSEMVAAAATGSLNGHSWKNLGLSVKWAEFNVGSTNELSYNYNDYGDTPPSGWRKPTKAEVSELFYASSRTWLTGTTNAVRFDCNNNYIIMGAGGIYYYWYNNAYSEGDRVNNEGTVLHFWVADAEYDCCVISSEGSTLSFGNYPYYYNSRNDSYRGYNAAVRLVCDYE